MTIVLSLRVHHLDAIGMMERAQLERYRFFSRIGMFSVVREDARSAVRSLRYAASELRSRHRVLWMFPQGTLVQQDHRPLVVEPGIGIIAAMLPVVQICPVALRYDLVNEQYPECHIRYGEMLRYTSASAATVTADVQAALTTVADQCRHDVIDGNTAAYQTVIAGRRSVNRRYDDALHRTP